MGQCVTINVGNEAADEVGAEGTGTNVNVGNNQEEEEEEEGGCEKACATVGCLLCV